MHCALLTAKGCSLRPPKGMRRSVSVPALIGPLLGYSCIAVGLPSPLRTYGTEKYWINRSVFANVHVRYMLSPVCLSSVCNARAPYSGCCNFPQYFYGIWYSTVSRARCAGALSCWKTNTSPAMLQIAVAASASAIRLGNTAPDSTKMRLVQPSLAAARAHVSSTNPRYGQVAETSCCDMG